MSQSPPARAIPSRSRLSLLAAAGLALAAAALVPLSPAHAGVPAHPAVFVDNTDHRSLSDLAPGSGTSYTVSASAGFQCASPTNVFRPLIVRNALSAPPNAGAGGNTTQLGNTFSASGDNPLVALYHATVNPGGLPPRAWAPSTDVLPGSWYADVAGDPADLSAALTDGTYTLAIACVTTTSSPGTAGNPVAMAWSTLTVSGGTWSLETDGSSPAPAAQDTTTTIAESNASTHELTATVTAADGATSPTGSVQFTEDGTNVGSAQALAPGSARTATASFTPTSDQLAVGTHHFSASYAGVTGSFNGSNADAAPVTVTITAPPPAAANTFVAVTAALNAADHTSADVTATVSTAAGGAAADGADGTVQFYVDGTADSDALGDPLPVTDGAASGTLTGLTPGGHTFTALFTPSDAAKADFKASVMSDPTDAVIVPTPLADGDTELTPGTTYEVTQPAGTFTDGGTVHVQLHSDPVDLADATAAADGSLVYDFVLPADIPAGAHSLVFTDATDATKTATVAFTVAGDSTDDPGADPGDDPGTSNAGGSGGNGPGDSGPGDSGVADPGSNDPVSFATGWVAHTVKTPVGLAGVFLLAFLAAAAGAGAWVLIWRRRTAAAR